MFASEWNRSKEFWISRLCRYREILDAFVMNQQSTRLASSPAVHYTRL